MSKTPKPCMDCGRLPKALPRHFCQWCILKRQPVHVQAEAAIARRALIPEHLRLKRSQKIVIDDTPEGLAFCAGCQSYMPLDHYGKGATQCRGCVNAKNFERSVAKTYGITKDEYDRILDIQGGACAICRRKPTGDRRLAVDHDHKTGVVRGLLCSGEKGCNHGGLGSFHDDRDIVWRAFLYLSNPPATQQIDDWVKYTDDRPPVVPKTREEEVREILNDSAGPFSKPRKVGPARGSEKAGEDDPGPCLRPHFAPIGSEPVPGKQGLWRIWVDTSNKQADPPF